MKSLPNIKARIVSTHNFRPSTVIKTNSEKTPREPTQRSENRAKTAAEKRKIDAIYVNQCPKKASAVLASATRGVRALPMSSA
jgi:hypothetical protein